MSKYAYLVCDKTKRSIFIGKPLRDEDGSVNRFAVGQTENSRNSNLTRALWKFLADNANGPFRIMYDSDDDFEFVADNYVEIGLAGDNGVIFPEYLRDWPG